MQDGSYKARESNKGFDPSELLYCETVDHPYLREQLLNMRERLALEPDAHKRDEIVRRMWRFLRELRGQAGRSWVRPLVAALAGCAVVVGVIKYGEKKAASHLRVLHDVLVTARIDDYNFKFSAYDPYTATWNEASLTACKTFKPTQEIQAGVTLTLLQYEKQDKGCVDFTLLSNGYTLLRGEHNEPILTDPRSSAWATVSRPAAETTSTTSGTGTETARRPVAEGVKQ